MFEPIRVTFSIDAERIYNLFSIGDSQGNTMIDIIDHIFTINMLSDKKEAIKHIEEIIDLLKDVEDFDQLFNWYEDDPAGSIIDVLYGADEMTVGSSLLMELLLDLQYVDGVNMFRRVCKSKIKYLKGEEG